MDVFETTYADVIDILDEHVLGYLPLLKHAIMFRKNAQYFKLVEQNVYLVLMTFASTLTHHDRRLYPDAAAVSMISGTYPQGIPRCLELLPSGKNIIKTELDLSQLHTPTPRKIRTLYSFTNTRAITLAHLVDLVGADSVNVDFAPLFTQVGYTLDEVQHTLRDGGHVFAIFNGTTPISGCLVFPIYKNIWEIGAVATMPAYRQRGLGSAVVAMANNDLLEQRYIPRYNVEQTNLASVHLAQKLGFQRYLEFIHYEITLTA
jgi:ribosomal protein S18 acetylase RimI-like enzyme